MYGKESVNSNDSTNTDVKETDSLPNEQELKLF